MSIDLQSSRSLHGGDAIDPKNQNGIGALNRTEDRDAEYEYDKKREQSTDQRAHER